MLIESEDSYETTTFLFMYFIFKLYVKSAIQKHLSVAPNKNDKSLYELAILDKFVTKIQHTLANIILLKM